MTTVGMSLDIFCRGLLRELSGEGYEVVAIASPDDSLANLCKREGVRGIGVEMRREIAPLADLRSLIRLTKVLRREKPRMIHTMTPKAGLLGMMAARIAGVPVRVHTFTGLLFPTATGLRRRLLRFTDRITCLCATDIIAEGHGVAADLHEGGVTAGKPTVLGHGNVRGIDLDHYRVTPDIRERGKEIREKLGIPGGAFVFIFIGRLVGDKGLRELGEAFRAIGRDDCHLVIAGDTEGGRDDIDTAQLAAIPGVHLSEGWVSDVRPWLAMADALVFPSYREGFPNVVLEAGAMGIPSVVTDINGSREIITDGYNGLIAKPRDRESLLASMQTMLSMPRARLERMGADAREDVERRFAQPYVRKCLKDFYRRLLQK